MMHWTVIVALMMICLTALYAMEMRRLHGPELRGVESFESGRGDSKELEGADMPDIADINNGPLLRDIMKVKTGLSGLGADACASQDRAREMEMGGQYTQRTNNYQRDYPDNCSAAITEFVDSIYEPRDGVGLTVPCAGSCGFPSL
jgi:hypothetical protein